jgi:uncharacterized protein YggU (UPF0235/DUF167 family)
VPSRDVCIVRGETSRTKVVVVRGITAGRAEKALGTDSAR